MKTRLTGRFALPLRTLRRSLSPVAISGNGGESERGPAVLRSNPKLEIRKLNPHP
jgi:hypothetical protein